jgi:ankyrin repeat protein
MLEGLQKGNSGCWVVQKTTNTVYGHISAFSAEIGYLIPLVNILEELSEHHGGGAVLPSPLGCLADLASYWSEQNDDSLASTFAEEMMSDNACDSSNGSLLHDSLRDLIRRHLDEKEVMMALFKTWGRNLPDILIQPQLPVDFRRLGPMLEYPYVQTVMAIFDFERSFSRTKSRLRKTQHDASSSTLTQPDASSSTIRLEDIPQDEDLPEVTLNTLARTADPRPLDVELYDASCSGHQSMVQALILAGADVNVQGGYFNTALQAASALGRKDIVQILVDAGADVNIQGGYLGNALQAASDRGYKEIVQTLVDAGADVNVQGGDYSTALQAASACGHKDIVQILVDAGANVNVQGGDCNTALLAASANGYKDIVQTLVDAGADINIQGGIYNNALQAASAYGHEDIVQILVDAGADINIQGGFHGTALQAASERGYK